MLPEFLRNISERLKRKHTTGKIEQSIRYLSSRIQNQATNELNLAANKTEVDQVLLKFWQNSLGLTVSTEFLTACFLFISTKDEAKWQETMASSISNIDDAIKRINISYQAGQWPSKEWLTRNIYLKVLQTIDKAEYVCAQPDPSIQPEVASQLAEASKITAKFFRNHFQNKISKESITGSLI